MPSSVITVGTFSATLIPTPPVPLRSVEFNFEDAIAQSPRSFTGQMQTQAWPGADLWSGTATFAPLTQLQADQVIAFLMGLRGLQNSFQMGDPLKKVPRGTAAGAPAVDNTQNNGNPAMSQQIGTKGWTASAAGVLLAGDYMQVGYRLHRVVYDVNADSSGNAVIAIWPSLREVPTNSSAIATSNCQGLMRLAQNKRGWASDYTRLSKISFPFMEYR
jgi:hypothetical protein